MFDWLRRAYLTLRGYVRRRKETEVPLGEPRSNIISRADIRTPKGRGFESRPSHHYDEDVKDTRRNIVSAVLWCKNQRLNVEKIFAVSKPFLKRSSNLGGRASSQFMTIYHRLTASFCACWNVRRGRGVDIFS